MVLAYKSMGQALFALGQSRNTVVAYSKAIELLPDDSDLYKYQGDALSAIGRHTKAMDMYTKAIKLHPVYGSSCCFSNCITMFNYRGFNYSGHL